MTTTNKRIVGKIYANWCGACKALEPAWTKMEEHVGGKVDVVNIESEKQDEKIKEFNTKHGTDLALQKGYPTMFSLNHGGSLEYYNGDRSEKALIDWAMNKKQNGGKNNNKKSKKNKSRKNKSRKHRKH